MTTSMSSDTNGTQDSAPGRASGATEPSLRSPTTADQLILIVDDEQDLCLNLGRYFKRQGFQASTAFTGSW